MRTGKSRPHQLQTPPMRSSRFLLCFFLANIPLIYFALHLQYNLSVFVQPVLCSHS